MALTRLGEIGEFMLNERFTLQINTATNSYYMGLQDLIIQVSRPESRRGTTDNGAKYAFGQGDNFFSATLIATKPEISGTSFTNGTTFASFNELSQLNANNELDELEWVIVGESSAGSDTTFACTGVLKQYAVRKGEKGFVYVDVLVRITGDTVTIT